MVVFATRYTTRNVPGTRMEVMSPTVTGTAPTPGLLRPYRVVASVGLRRGRRHRRHRVLGCPGREPAVTLDRPEGPR
jgi:hypothetical protein